LKKLQINKYQFRTQYINYLLSQGLDRVAAVRLFDKGTGRGDYGYSAGFYAREELACKKHLIIQYKEQMNNQRRAKGGIEL
jgi:hypothetical protein